MVHRATHVEWSDADARHAAECSVRYPGALDLTIKWIDEAVNDDEMVMVDPYPRSRMGATGFIGYSPSAARVLVVIAYLGADQRWHGRTAWPATGRDMGLYKEGLSNDET